MRYECYVGAPGMFLLSQACLIVRRAYDAVPYLVGSALTSKTFRDVDVRLILPDQRYVQTFPGIHVVANPRLHPLWSLHCSAISLLLGQASGLPVDFQIQSQSAANQHPGATARIPLGIYPEPAVPR